MINQASYVHVSDRIAKENKSLGSGAACVTSVAWVNLLQYIEKNRVKHLQIFLLYWALLNFQNENSSPISNFYKLINWSY